MAPDRLLVQDPSVLLWPRLCRVHRSLGGAASSSLHVDLDPCSLPSPGTGVLEDRETGAGRARARPGRAARRRATRQAREQLGLFRDQACIDRAALPMLSEIIGCGNAISASVVAVSPAWTAGASGAISCAASAPRISARASSV